MGSPKEVKLDLKDRLQLLARRDSPFVVSELTSAKELEDLFRKTFTSYGMVLVMKILAKVCEADSDINVFTILTNACYTGFVKQIEKLVSSLDESEKYRVKTSISNVPEFVNNTLLFCKTVKKHFPETYLVLLRNIDCICTVAMKGKPLSDFFDNVLQLQPSGQNKASTSLGQHARKRNSVLERETTVSNLLDNASKIQPSEQNKTMESSRQPFREIPKTSGLNLLDDASEVKPSEQNRISERFSLRARKIPEISGLNHLDDTSWVQSSEQKISVSMSLKEKINSLFMRETPVNSFSDNTSKAQPSEQNKTSVSLKHAKETPSVVRRATSVSKLLGNSSVLQPFDQNTSESSRLQTRERYSKTELPPNNFREIEIFPTLEETLSLKSPFIRPIKVKGSYENLEHYLDIHFRLLREDFIRPLREGVCAFMDQDCQSCTENRTTNNVKIFKGVKFLQPRKVYFRLGYAVLFDPKRKLKDVEWETTKRLISGSLLLFTHDNFKTIILGTVMDRSLGDIRGGVIVVELHGSVHPKDLNHEFIMVETSVHFGSYRYALAALQNINVCRFPMERYIVEVQCEVKPPKYLLRKLAPVYQIHGSNVQVFDIPRWPSAEKLGIDVSQYKALQSALTKEFVVIQGPPGTGKTFLAEMVTQALLANVSEFPILIICYTNHALDQFLEKLIKSPTSLSQNHALDLFLKKPIESLTSLIRVGGQCQSDALEEYNLKANRRVYRKNNHQVQEWIRSSEFPECAETLKDTQMLLKAIHGNHGIVSLKILKRYNVTSHLYGICSVANWLYDGSESIPKYIKQGFDHHQDKLPSDYFDISLDELAKNITNLERQLKHTSNKRVASELQKKIDTLHHVAKYFKQKLSEYVNIVSSHKRMATYPLDTPHGKKWQTYSSWIEILKNKLEEKLKEQQREYQMKLDTYTHEMDLEDFQILKNCKIIGMTTTRAARDLSILQKLQPKIVIVEEAAEVLESNIVASLTSHCEHLILIGDHKQLRPSSAVYELATRFHLDISLFERMVENGMDCNQLQFQHRMRPEIASLIVPAIYPSLNNHPAVLKYKDVVGIAKNLYFVTHKFSEELVPKTTSYRNEHEADFLIALCKHLLIQGYSPSQITILATYSGQMSLFKELKNHDRTLATVCMTTVDNYQGEQNDIILLSLVRSNETGTVGFLKTENRVCVALSRARKGLYIVGNMDILRKGKSIWNKIYNTLEEQRAIDTHLPLKCQKHPSVLTHVASAKDFMKMSPKGGCTLACNKELACGHRCKLVCHTKSEEHECPTPVLCDY